MKTIALVSIALVLVLLLSAFAPGGKVRIVYPGSTPVSVSTPALAVTPAAVRGFGPGRGGATPPPICSQPGGPRC